jgi:hypothetical protein
VLPIDTDDGSPIRPPQDASRVRVDLEWSKDLLELLFRGRLEVQPYQIPLRHVPPLRGAAIQFDGRLARPEQARVDHIPSERTQAFVCRRAGNHSACSTRHRSATSDDFLNVHAAALRSYAAVR